MSSVAVSLAKPLTPFFVTNPGDTKETAVVQGIIDALQMQQHPEGGYFVETDRDFRTVPNPFLADDSVDASDKTRSASTTIFYLISPKRPMGAFHRNKARTMHTLHQGRGRYVIVHADEAHDGGKARLETFVVGHDLSKGEKLQWMVEGGKYKASYLLPDSEDGTDSRGLLIMPGFDFADHDFMTAKAMEQLLTPEQVKELSWMLNRN
ncbi:MAG: hypothetical protein M1828_000676 [Chrysothrix sp. TS-e1954]|nr:MAG: hypothetical protein M1828_000676 [Chrysothrix sp. TS-e1954]